MRSIIGLFLPFHTILAREMSYFSKTLYSMLKHTFLFVLLGFVGFQHIFAQDGGTLAPKYSNEFLQIGIGGKAMGLSNAVVASVDDVSSSYWNPAGLTRMSSKFQGALMHSEYFAGIAKYDYLGISYKIDDKSAVGFTAIRFGVDDIPNTTQLIDNNGNIDYDKITRFTAADYGFLFSYARQLPIEGLTFGANAKVIYRKVGDFASAYGFGLDFGMQYKYKKWNFGAVMRDAVSTFNAWVFNLDEQTKEVFLATGNEIPQNGLELTLPRLILGAHRKFELGEKGFSIAPEINAAITTDGRRNVLISAKPFSIEPYMGLQFGFKDIVAVRMGVGNMQRVTNFDESKELNIQPNIGIGFRISAVHIDYAYTNIGGLSAALYSHVISLKIHLNQLSRNVQPNI
jgi:hypothetical protein